jgi:hypothetical protein
LWGVAVAVILTACSRELPIPTWEDELPAPPEQLIQDPRILDSPDARTIILVRVGELERPEYAGLSPYATMFVLKSWNGPFSAGDVLHTPKGFVACGSKRDDCRLYNFQLGDRGKEFLIMSLGGQKRPEEPDLIFVRRKWVWPAAKSRALMAALDQAVVDAMPTDKAGYAARLQKEEAAFKAVTTELRAALSNHAPETEINALSYQAGGHYQNASRFRIARDYLDKHPEKSGESPDVLVRAAYLEGVTAQQAPPR